MSLVNQAGPVSEIFPRHSLTLFVEFSPSSYNVWEAGLAQLLRSWSQKQDVQYQKISILPPQKGLEFPVEMYQV